MAPGDRLTADDPVTSAQPQQAAAHTGESHDDPPSAVTVDTAVSPGGPASADTEAASTHEAALEQSEREAAGAERAIAGRAEAGQAAAVPPAPTAATAHRPAPVATAGATAPAPPTPIDSTQIRRAITIAEKRTDLKWSVFVGTLGEDPRAQAEARHAELGPAAAKAVLIAVDPVSRRLEIVTGAEARAVLDDRSCALAAASMTSTFAVRDLDGGIAYGILAMVEHVRQAR